MPFKIILPSRLFSKLITLSLQYNTCQWIQDFLTDQQESVRVGPHNSTTLSLSIGGLNAAKPLSLLSVYTTVYQVTIPM